MQQTVDKQAVAAAFGRAAQSYNRYADLQRQCGEHLLALARPGEGLRVLDAGCGTGWFSQRWRSAGHHVTALDLSEKMLQQAALSQVADCYQPGDIEALPFAAGSFDRCWSSLAIQWCSDLPQALKELWRVTRPGGQVLFSTLLDGSLNEVQHAWQALGERAPVNQFARLRQLEQAAAGMNLTLTPYTLTLAFPDVLSLLRSLKGIGATHLHQGRGGQGLSRGQLQRLEAVWPRDVRGCLLSYQLVSGVMERE
ncbi:malonyl-ACP O-methyltransferase BioC [Erwinia persicina]|uniref:malonyl-ACP O-methyltransferase BioC n=1 Tax=Erwinia persicina TaxID=55211 RepID=UPI001786CA05|nr:malonyl-ACP O-methyltransferase BioC [Erwinia persicina]MBD8163052.1 malonyl-ACP O-methyltransferase BioC [Erwinia persicina]MBD8214211.1 malonyl-ACP O-methyltransferase BioC [Erwinia persicina]